MKETKNNNWLFLVPTFFPLFPAFPLLPPACVDTWLRTLPGRSCPSPFLPLGTGCNVSKQMIIVITTLLQQFISKCTLNSSSYIAITKEENRMPNRYYFPVSIRRKQLPSFHNFLVCQWKPRYYLESNIRNRLKRERYKQQQKHKSTNKPLNICLGHRKIIS